MKCLIIDDEPLAIEGITLMLQKIPSLQLCQTFSNIIEADSYLLKNKVDLIFLDIQLPELSGIDYLQMRSNLPQIIITTAYPEYALDGYDLNVTDYLVKPVRFERFYRAVNKALQKHQSENLLKPGDLIEVEDSYLFVRSDKKFVRVSISNITYIEGMKDYCIMHLPKEKITVPLNLRSVSSRLPEGYFMRISKSFIINLMQIKYVDSDFVYIDEQQIPIGETYRTALMSYISKAGILRR
jgi:DNA-binding LytR/AlgR family response regulator